MSDAKPRVKYVNEGISIYTSHFNQTIGQQRWEKMRNEWRAEKREGVKPEVRYIVQIGK